MRKRLLILIGTFLFIYILNFFIPRMMPGDPITYAMEGGESMSGVSDEQLQKLSAYYGLDKPLWAQFISTLKDNLRGEFGQSIYYKKPVSEIIFSRLPWTLYIMTASLTLSLIFGVAVAACTHRKRRLDSIVYGALSLITEIPGFLIGILLLFFVAARVKFIPLSGSVTAFKTYSSTMEFLQDVLMHSLMPILAIVLITAPNFYFVARSSFLTIHDRKYILNAQAKGLPGTRIQVHYILRNTAFPIVACLFMSVGGVIGGTLLLENVFAYPGLGTVIKESVRYRDYALIQGVFLLSSTIVILSSYIADMMNRFIGKEE